MAGERLAQLAVDATIDWLTAQLQTYATAVELARGLTAGTLTPPVEIKGADLPDYGGAMPILEVYENVAKPLNLENKVWSFDLSVILTWASDADIDAGRQLCRDYGTALTDCFQAGRTLGGRVGSALITDVSYAAQRSGGARHLQHVAVGLEVRLFDA